MVRDCEEKVVDRDVIHEVSRSRIFQLLLGLKRKELKSNPHTSWDMPAYPYGYQLTIGMEQYEDSLGKKFGIQVRRENFINGQIDYTLDISSRGRLSFVYNPNKWDEGQLGDLVQTAVETDHPPGCKKISIDRYDCLDEQTSKMFEVMLENIYE